MKKRLLAGLLATSIALSISMGAFPAMAATNDDFVEDWEGAADFTDDSYSSGYSSSEQLFDDIIFFDLDEEVDDTAAEIVAEEDANDSSDTEIDKAADSIEETEPEDEVQVSDAAKDRNDLENPEEAGPSDAETEEDVPDSWEETPKIDSDLEAAIASEDPFSYYDDNAFEEEMDDDIALLAAEKTIAHKGYTYTDVSSGTAYMVDLYTDHTAKIRELTTSSGEAECILPSTIYYTDDNGIQEPDPYTVTALSLSYWSGVTSDNNNYTSLVLPDTLTDIGGSLSGFKKVTEITIPGSVKVFNATLQNMKELKTLTFDEGVEEIASGSVVSGCTKLETIHLPSSLQKLSGTGTFSGASALTDITLPEGIAITEGSTFSECTSLKSIELPASITTIPRSMFAGCSALEHVTAKGTITAIGNRAFGSVTDWNNRETADTALTEIPDLSQVTSIGDRAFYGCSALTTVDLHSVTTMGYGAFQGCAELSGEIDLSNLKVIPGNAFCYDPKITSVITCPMLKSIGDWAFIWAEISTISLPETLNSIGSWTFCGASLSGTVALPDSLTKLGENAFYGCKEIEAIQIGSGLTDIPKNAFDGCTNLKAITVNNRREDVAIPKIDGVTVTYTIPSLTADNDKISTAADALSLQAAVNQASGTPVTIEKDIRLNEPVKITAGQKVEITATENHNIFGNKDENLANLFVVEAGGELSLTGALTLGGWNNTGSILVNHGKTTIDGNVVIEKSTLEGDSMGVIEDNGSSAELILENGTIQNHKIRGACSASIRVTEGASFTMNGGTIQDNIANTSSSDSSSPAVLLLGASTFTMNEGSICNNSGQCGTAVYLTASSNDAKARFTMNGGTLSNNESRSYTLDSTPTGAVFVKHSAEFVLNNGTITGNCAYGGAGGGVAVMDELPTKEHCTAFTMYNGTISNNTASGYSGGGIYSCSNHVSLLGGRIENNSAYDGGGVYSEGNTKIYTTLHIQNALITENTADQGGGLWFCPTGDAKLYMQNGAVIYGNTATSAGDDFASPEVATGAGGNGGVTLPDYFPNGKVIQWFSDGFLYAPHGNLGTYGQGTRYNAVEYAKRVTGVQNEKKGLALKSVVSDGVSIPAVGLLIITGNHASHGGGGIGANGGVVIGEATSLSNSISVKKVWDNPGYEDTQPSGVTIHLKERDTGDVVSTAELTDENGWQYTFTDLPLSPNHYTVTEQPLEGYKATYYQDADGNFIITNTYLTTPTPDVPDVPAVTISVPVEKKWVNDYKWERPASIHVSLWNGDTKVKEADLTADMGWTYIFEDLPEGSYSVTEDAVPGYETLIERSDAGGFIITNTYERPLDPEPIEPIDPIPPVDPPQEEIVTPPIVPETTGNEPSPPSTEETTSAPPTEPTEESTEESTEERSAESDPEESPIKETQETPSVSAKPPKLIQTGQTWWPVFLLMFAGVGLLVFGFYKRSKENIDHE